MSDPTRDYNALGEAPRKSEEDDDEVLEPDKDLSEMLGWGVQMLGVNLNVDKKEKIHLHIDQTVNA